MRTLVFVCAIAILITSGITRAYARVVAGNLDNGVAVYYFNSLTDSGNVSDYSTNGLHGLLFGGAQLATISNRECLSLGSNAAKFSAWDDNKSLSVSKEFSMVAWVKIPQQTNNFLISVYAYNGPIADISDNVEAGAEGSVYLAVDADNTLRSGYVFDDHRSWVQVETTGRNINNNQWRHVAFVINSTTMKLYLNGNQVATQSVSGHQSFYGTGSIIFIGEYARGSVDNVGMFKNDFSGAQVKLIYDKGLANIISIATVDSNGKVTTTWAALKKR